MAAKNRLPRSTPEAQGVSSSAILKFVEAADKHITDLHSLMLLRHGTVVAEGWWSPYSPQRPHMLYSLSKSFTSTAIGMAVAEGRLSIDDRVLSFFPDDAPERVSKHLDAMRVRHLLSMSTGHAEDTTGYLHRRRDGNWTKAFLARPVKHEPGTFFLYNTGATYMLSAIVQKVTGEMLLDYLQPRLFKPLGIKNPTWEVSPQGINTGGYGLAITTEDIARFGQLYLQQGQWNGQQLLPESWVAQASAKQVSNGSDPNNDWNQGYGFQFWRCRHNLYRGDGAFGQYCIVMPDQDAVLAMTGGVTDMGAVMNLAWEYVLPGISKRASLVEQAKTHEKLLQRLDSLAYAPPQGKASSATAARVSGKTYALDSNPGHFKALSLDFSQPEAVLTLRTPRGTHQMTLGAGEWHAGELGVFYHHNALAVGSGVWTSKNTFTITLRYVETPYVYTLACRFEGKRLTVDGVINVNFGPTTFTLTGQAQ